jgi:putative transposase
MPNYRRVFSPGGTFFFTVVTYQRQPIFAVEAARACLRHSFRQIEEIMPYETLAFVLFPDHLHCMWKLPEGGSAYSTRWGRIKSGFTRQWRQCHAVTAGLSQSRRRHRESNLWQRRFWEHTIRDEMDFRNHIDYVHYNPIKHGYVHCAHAWPHSTYQRWVREGFYSNDWCCQCDGAKTITPHFTGLNEADME